jgi:hypothetical protein
LRVERRHDIDVIERGDRRVLVVEVTEDGGLPAALCSDYEIRATVCDAKEIVRFDERLGECVVVFRDGVTELDGAQEVAEPDG